MKTTLRSIIAFMLVGFMSGNLDAKASLTVEGQFINQRNVQYDLYVQEKDSSYTLVSSFVARKYYSVQVEEGAAYLLKFTSPSGDIKYLMINPYKKGYFRIDVDFCSPNSARVYYAYSGYTYGYFDADMLKLPQKG